MDEQPEKFVAERLGVMTHWPGIQRSIPRTPVRLGSYGDASVQLRIERLSSPTGPQARRLWSYS